MTITIDEYRLKDFIAEAVAIGIRRHDEYMRSQEKTINQTQAQNYLKKVGLPASLLAKMVDRNLVTPIKLGEARSSRVKYSTAQFYKAVDEIRMNNKLALLHASATD